MVLVLALALALGLEAGTASRRKALVGASIPGVPGEMARVPAHVCLAKVQYLACP